MDRSTPKNPVVVLRSVKSEDLALLLAWRSDREVMQYLPSAPINPTWEEQVRWWSEQGDRITWIVMAGGTSQWNPPRPVGEVHIDIATSEVGLLIGEKSAWGSGIGYAALTALLEQMSLLHVAATDLWAAIHRGNTRSQHLFASVGFVKTGAPARNGQEEWRYKGEAGEKSR